MEVLTEHQNLEYLFFFMLLLPIYGDLLRLVLYLLVGMYKIQPSILETPANRINKQRFKTTGLPIQYYESVWENMNWKDFDSVMETLLHFVIDFAHSFDYLY